MSDSDEADGKSIQNEVIIKGKEADDGTSEIACTQGDCKKEADQYMLHCTKCKKHTHYACTMLPPYQLSLFMQSGYRLYKCSNCVGEVDDSITKCYAAVPAKYKMLSKKLHEDKANLINDNISKERQIEKINNEKMKLKSEYVMLKEAHASLQEQFAALTNEKTSTDEQLENLKKKTVRRKSRDTGAAMSSDVPRYVTIDCMSEFKTELISTVSKIVDQKLSSLDDKIQNVAKIPEVINDKCESSFTAALKKNIPLSTPTELRKVIAETKNNDLVQERERKQRAKNIIIHGINEAVENDNEHDVKYVNDLFAILAVTEKPTSIARLGAKSAGKTRPLKLVLKSEEEKDTLMLRLPNLRNAEAHFRKISVTNDYTVEEREEVRRFVDMAKVANDNEPQDSKFIWKVRGDPKNGLQVKKFPKRQTVQLNN